MELKEGEDYYIERGYWVFTAAFLRRRGYCCGSGCRHCPYRGEAKGVGEATENEEREEVAKKAE